eukprot:12013613-Ditylum_brightwellii.AAC.1
MRSSISSVIPEETADGNEYKAMGDELPDEDDCRKSMIRLREIVTKVVTKPAAECANELSSWEHFRDVDLVTNEIWSSIDCVLEQVIEEEFPYTYRPIPNLRNIINVGDLKESRYSPGSWVEIRGADMKWRLGIVIKVSKEAPPDYDWNDPQNQNKEPE